MGGLGPGIGGLEYLLIAIVALVVVGPERLPVMLRQLGRMIGKARAMANEFRASFDDMARQSELDELRKEVDALRTGQMVPLGAAADEAFKDIKAELEKPAYVETPPNAVILDRPEFPEPTVTPPEADLAPVPAKVRKPRAKAATPSTDATPDAKPTRATKPRAPRKPPATA